MSKIDEEIIKLIREQVMNEIMENLNLDTYFRGRNTRLVLKYGSQTIDYIDILEG